MISTTWSKIAKKVHSVLSWNFYKLVVQCLFWFKDGKRTQSNTYASMLYLHQLSFSHRPKKLSLQLEAKSQKTLSGIMEGECKEISANYLTGAATKQTAFQPFLIFVRLSASISKFIILIVNTSKGALSIFSFQPRFGRVELYGHWQVSHSKILHKITNNSTKKLVIKTKELLFKISSTLYRQKYFCLQIFNIKIDWMKSFPDGGKQHGCIVYCHASLTQLHQ